MKNHLIAQRYARALIENISLEKHEDILADLELLTSLFDAEIIAKVSSRLLSDEQKSQITILIAAETSNSQLWATFFELLLQKKRIEIIVDILKELDEIIMEESNRMRVELTLAHEQTQEVLDSIKAEVTEILDREVIFSIVIDPSIIGGFEAKASSLEINASIRSSLEKFISSGL